MKGGWGWGAEEGWTYEQKQLSQTLTWPHETSGDWRGREVKAWRWRMRPLGKGGASAVISWTSLLFHPPQHFLHVCLEGCTFSPSAPVLGWGAAPGRPALIPSHLFISDIVLGLYKHEKEEGEPLSECVFRRSRHKVNPEIFQQGNTRETGRSD